MVDNGENILVEFDYQNITVIDPNKVIDENGKAKERLVKHENLVMYANLECKVIPRSKLVLGASNSDNLRTISVTSMNFLNPGEKTYLDNAYTDEITGKDTIKGEGVNQQRINLVQTPNKSDEFYYTQSTYSNKEPKATDNGLLGIKSITVKINSAFEPVINIKMEDIKGRALFESGNDSPYAAFFNLPYPLFYLTLKGFYGKAVRLPLMLQDFTSSYNSGTGNFEIDLVMYSYKFTVISEISLAAMIATPHMYKSTVQVQPKKPTGGIPVLTPKVNSKTQVVEYGTQKIKEMYSEYKNRGLIPDDFPELTVNQMFKRLEQFIQTILSDFEKQNLDPLTYVSEYGDNLNDYRGEIFYYTNSWFNKYMDVKNFYVLKKGFFGESKKVYYFSPSFSAQTASDTAKSELRELITFHNNRLSENPVCGTNGKYEIGGQTPKSSSIINKIEEKTFYYELPIRSEDVDFKETWFQTKGTQPDVESIEYKKFELDFDVKNLTQSKVQLKDGTPERVLNYFIFEGKNSFISYTDEMLKQKASLQEEIEKALTNALAEKVKDKNNSLGFVPTIRNVLSVIFANGEAFLRLLDEVHTKAWNQRDNAVRKAPIFSVPANPDSNKQGDTTQIPIYPWPEMIKETSGDNGQEKFETVYPGDPEVINQTKGFLYDYWPEVEFVEEFTKGISKKIEDEPEQTKSNEVTDVKRLSMNAIEFPTNNQIYENKEEVKYFYEIYERLMLTSYYSKFYKTVKNPLQLSKITQAVAGIESTNIVNSLGNGNPFLQYKLFNYAFSEGNYLNTLKEFSNLGIGESWQNFIRGVFNTQYIKKYTENNGFLITGLNSKVSILGSSASIFDVNPTESSPEEQNIREYITGTTISNVNDITDTYPFVEVEWDNKYMAGSFDVPAPIPGFVPVFPNFTPINDYYDTTKNLHYNSSYKVVSNFSGGSIQFTPNEPKPFSSYCYRKIEIPSTQSQNASKPYLYLAELNEFYKERFGLTKSQYPTEGDVHYKTNPGLLTRFQTVSMLNTPYFTNAIQEGVTKFRNFDPYPYTVPAYMFLNSLPIGTLREKYTLYKEENGTVSTDYLNYIFATFKKYGAIHKIPLAWVLKIGSVWHRYKVWVETGVDILDNSWKSFNQVENFDPVTSAATTTYSLTLDGGQNVDIVLTKDSSVSAQTYTQINTGFYPETINDFNVFYQGFRIFTGYTNSDIQTGITNGFRAINSQDSNIVVGFSGNPTDPNRFLQVNAWSTFVLTPDKNYCYLMPSHGSLINQTKDECIKDGVNVINIRNNQYVFDGSVRSLWSAPNYGYFATSLLVKPNPDEYLKKVLSTLRGQENFSIRNNTSQYTNISEMFSVFEKGILDEFEKQFLNFSKSKYNFEEFESNQTETEISFNNFHLFFTELMRLPAPSTLLTATQTINQLEQTQSQMFQEMIEGFMNYDVLIKNGNPSNFDKNLFYSFSKKSIENPLVFQRYSVLTPNALPSSAGTQTLAGSKLNYPNAWNALLTYVGFSDIDGIAYSNTGSTIFDFFIDNDIEFTEDNVKLCSPIIKMYATQKYLKKVNNAKEFNDAMTLYIDNNFSFIDKSLNKLFTQLRKKLENIKIVKENEQAPTLESKQTKLELYQSFKATNDKWISGNDYKNKTLFEDVLLLDSASRNVGDVFVVDIYQIKEMLDPKLRNPDTNMYIIVNSVLSHNNFKVFNVPSYVNFYNVQEATKNPFPKPEGTLEFANTLFGTFLDVDYRKSSTKMVCFYPGEPSKQLDTEGVIQGWNGDAFDLRRPTNNPLLENPINKRDFDKSNKVVGFNVDIGPQNQGIFNTFSVSQKNGTSTAESLQLLSEMSRQAGNRNVATQNTSLYNLYKLRSYDCNVTMLGNALIQPLMYFNLRYVPMFAGPYMITEVSHSISPGSFTTQFTGVRQKINGPPRQLDFLQSLKTNLLDKIISDKKVEIQKQRNEDTKNNLSDKQSIVQNSIGENKPQPNAECSGITRYELFTKLEGSPQESVKSVKSVKDKIRLIGLNLGIPQQNINKLQYAIFAQMYLQGGKNTTVSGLENNFIGIDLNSNWGPNEVYFSEIQNNKPVGKYFCISRNERIVPFPKFDSIDKNIEFLYSRWRERAGLISQVTAEEIAIFVNTNIKPSGASPSNWFAFDEKSRKEITAKVQTSIDVYNAAN